MATDSWYSSLLRLYPQPFRERFGEGMAQSYQDLRREYTDAGRGQSGLALWIFSETLAGIIKETGYHMPQMGKTILRVALGALAVLMAPLVASQLIEDWHWGAKGFLVAYVFFFAVGMAYALISRKMKAWPYKAGVGVALATGFALAWSNMVHVADSENPANLAYYSVILVGAIGASLARLRPQGLARTLFVMAGVLALIAAILPSGAPPNLARNMAIGHACYVALFTASGLMFRQASQPEKAPLQHA